MTSLPRRTTAEIRATMKEIDETFSVANHRRILLAAIRAAMPTQQALNLLMAQCYDVVTPKSDG